VLAGSLLLARGFYLAAVTQAGQVAGLFQVAFDLYRHSILVQIGINPPSDRADEQALWGELTSQITSLRGEAASRDTPSPAAR
ncbi:MAG: hypothetical protein ACR2J8_07885, partial [Thermomicrobiales bacterium]